MISRRRHLGTAWKIATGAYALTLLCLSLVRLPTSAAASIPNFDKLLHFTAYAILALLMRMVLKYSGARSPYLSALLISTCFGAIVEGLQFLLTDYRFFSFGDIVANALGAALALLAVKWACRAENYIS